MSLTSISSVVHRAECFFQKRKQQRKVEDQRLLAKINMDLRKKRWAEDEANEKANEFMDKLYNKLEKP